MSRERKAWQGIGDMKFKVGRSRCEMGQSHTQKKIQHAYKTRIFTLARRNLAS